MDFEDIPEAEESPVIVQEADPYYFEENPMMAAPEIIEEEPYYYEQPPNLESSMQAMQMPPPVPEQEQDAWMMPEPEADDALTTFNKIWNEKLEAKRASEFEAEQAVRAKAGQDMSTWTTQRDIRLHAKKDTNRSEEQILLETLESEVDAANTWDRVAKLIDASNDTTAADNADVTRMRKLFIQLKNQPLETTRSASA